MKTPPFGKPLRDLLMSGQIPNNDVYLFIGEKAWYRGKASSISRPTRTLVLPPNEPAFYYDWPVSDCDILIIETSPVDTDYIEDFVRLLFSFNAKKIMLISTNFLSTIYKKDF